MKISKKNLLSLIKENITEMAMDFDPNMPERPHTDIQAKLQTGDTPIQKVPLPKTGRENDNPSHNYQELLASQRYKQVISNLRNIGHVTAPVTQINNPNDYMRSPITQIMAGAHNRIIQLENAHKTELEQLAVDLVTNVWQIPENYVQWDVKIVGMGEIDSSQFKDDQPGEENPEEVNLEGGDDEQYSDTVEIVNDLAQLNLDRAKRRFINMIIQGASKRGHYMYQMVPEELANILGDSSEELMYNYSVLMSTNDTLYWQMGEEMMGMAKGSVGGSEEVEPDTDPITIKVRAVNFPIAVHECIKGWLEVVALKGQPEDLVDREKYMQASEMEDTLDKERWDLLLGPIIWDKISEAIPDELYTNENLHSFQNFLLMEIFKLPSKKMLVLMKEVITHTPTGNRLLNELVNAIKENMEQFERDMVSYESNKSLQRFNDDLDEVTNQSEGQIDDFESYLNSLGIGLSDDDDDDDEDE